MTGKNQKRNIAIIGAGYWGKNLVRNYYELGVLRIVCDLDEELLIKFKENYSSIEITTSFDKVFKDEKVKAVVIASPAYTHYDLGKKALNHGKDVYIEKPLALDVEQGQELVNLAKKKKKILMVGHILQYHPVVVKLKELVSSGYLGKIQYIYSNRLNIGKLRTEENILWSFAPHDISVIIMLLDEMPISVESFGGDYLQRNIHDVTMTLLEFSSGKKAHIYVSWLHPFKEQRLVVVGSEKMAVFDDTQKTEKLLVYPHSIKWKEGKIPIASKAEKQIIKYEIVEPLREECLHFLSCIASRKNPKTDGEEGLRVLEILQNAQNHLKKSNIKLNTDKRDFFIHESSYFDESVEIGKDTKIWHFSHILKNTKIGKKCKIGQNVVIGPDVNIGDNCKIQNNVSIYKGVTLEDNVFCGPSMVFTNVFNPRSEVPRMNEIRKTHIGKGTSIGANATIVCGNNIGKYAFIGAGAVVTKEVPSYALVIGNPARISGWMCECGEKIKFSKNLGKCNSCKKKYKKNKNIVKKF